LKVLFNTVSKQSLVSKLKQWCVQEFMFNVPNQYDLTLCKLISQMALTVGVIEKKAK